MRIISIRCSNSVTNCGKSHACSCFNLAVSSCLKIGEITPYFCARDFNFSANCASTSDVADFFAAEAAISFALVTIPNRSAREIFLSASDVATAGCTVEEVAAVVVTVASTVTDSVPVVVLEIIASCAFVVSTVVVIDEAEVIVVDVTVSFTTAASDLGTIGSSSELVILAGGTELTAGTTSTGSPKLNSSSSSAALENKKVK